MITTVMEKLCPGRGGEAGKKCSKRPTKLRLVVWTDREISSFLYFLNGFQCGSIVLIMRLLHLANTIGWELSYF